MSTKATDSGGGRFFAFVLGAVAGGAVALLLSPQNGDELRQRLRQVADQTRDAANRIPYAIRQAGLAARDAFHESINGEEVGVGREISGA